jgi:hypothetical protein
MKYILIVLVVAVTVCSVISTVSLGHRGQEVVGAFTPSLLPGDPMPQGYICSYMYYELQRYCYDPSHSIYVTPKDDRVHSVTYQIDNKMTIGELLLQWGTPEGAVIGYSSFDVSWGDTVAYGIIQGSFSPSSHVLFISYGYKPDYPSWHGFRAS